MPYLRPVCGLNDNQVKVWNACDSICGLGPVRQNGLMSGIPLNAALVMGVVVLAVLLSGCCHPAPAPNSGAPSSPNQALLDELDAGKAWFHAKKTRPIRALKLDRDQTVDTLEGRVTAKAGDFLCRGEAGELWPVTAAMLEARYLRTEIVDADGWRKYEPRPDAEGVMAAQVPHPFTVTATWGRLSGKAGDYALKNFRDRAVPYPQDVWVVDRSLFGATYEAVRP